MTRHRVLPHCLLALVILVAGTTLLKAQIGNDNPTGISGQFNGNVTTGGSYDPYTGNATRSVTDIAVEGAVGSYGLAFGRIHNTRYYAGAQEVAFGSGGNWRHSYQWSIDRDSGYRDYYASDRFWTPSEYWVYYPDGRQVVFSAEAGFRAVGGGVSDRFEPLPYRTDPPLNVPYTDDCFLLLPDGGKVKFRATIKREQPRWNYPINSTFTFALVAIIDPHGLETVVSAEANGDLRITDKVGRSLTVFTKQPSFEEGNASGRVIDRVVASDGRTIQYHYSGYPTSWGGRWATLTGVTYPTDPNVPSPRAKYVYTPSNVDANARPLLCEAEDPMFAGRMWRIYYDYQTGVGVGHGQILRERHPGGTFVSTLTVDGDTRYETRGDGPWRAFYYSGGRLQRWTDFKDQNVWSSQTYDENGFVNSIKDRRGHVTDFARHPATGNVTWTWHPPTATEPARASTVILYGGDAGCDDGNNTDPTYVCAARDERGHWTRYWRHGDGSKRIWWIDYPDGSSEEFHYHALGPVEWHRLRGPHTNGRWERFVVDGRGLTRSYTPPATPSDLNPGANPTYYDYEGYDRLWQIRDPRGNRTRIYRNIRGQVFQVRHEDETYSQAGYEPKGTLAWTTDELGHTTTYTYDDYKRLLTVKNHLQETIANNDYAPWHGQGKYSHTSSSVFRTVSPMEKAVHYSYDENLRRDFVCVAPDHADSAVSYFKYDAAGNLTWAQDPRGKITTHEYDQRNRKTSTTAPLNQITRWEYDPTSRVTKEIRPDLSERRTEYDVVNRAIDVYGFGNQHTRQEFDYAGNLVRTIDPKNAVYHFGYDQLNRKTSATYPPDAYGVQRSEEWRYDVAGNLYQYTNPAGEVKTHEYDNRNRLDISGWSNNGPVADTTFDAANRLTRIATRNDETVVSFRYDDANRKKEESQTVGGVTHHLGFDYDEDGMRKLLVTDLHSARYRYNQRGDLAGLRDGTTEAEWISFAYDPSSNLTWRHTWTGSDQVFEYDDLNRTTMVESWTGGGWFGRSRYIYDNLSREIATTRDEQWGPLGAKGDTFAYDGVGQLLRARYNADRVWENGGFGWTREVNYDADALNRRSVTDNLGITNTHYQPPLASGVNQYTHANGGMSYDGKFNLTAFNAWGNWTYKHDANNRMVSANQGTISAGANRVENVYDGLGRCLKRTIDGVSRIYVYDGWSVVNEFTGSNAPICWNLFGPSGPDDIQMRVADAWGGGIHFYHKDRRGSVSFLTDTAGAKVEMYRYDAFGSPTVSDWGGGNPRTWSHYGNRFMFTGREYFAEMGIMDYRNRWYHPYLGRFLQPDPLGFAAGDINFFRYCGGDPVNNVDPFGLQTKDSNPPTQTDGKESPTGRGFGTIPGNVHGNSLDWRGPDGLPSGAGRSGADGAWNGGVGGFTTWDGSNLAWHSSPMFFPSGERSMFAAPYSGAAILQSIFYTRFGAAFEDAMRQRAGYVLAIPEQTIANAPELIVDKSEDELRSPGRMWPAATNRPWQGQYGTIYISKEVYYDPKDPLFAYRSYAHELANIVDAHLFRFAPPDGRFGSHFGLRGAAPLNDHDTGMAVELIIFGPRK